MENDIQQISGLEESQDDFLVLKFELFNEKEHAVQAEAVAKMLDAMILLINEAIVQQDDSNCYDRNSFLVKVEAIQEESLEIPISITQAILSTFPTFITTVNGIWQFIKNWFEIRLAWETPSQNSEKTEGSFQTITTETSNSINFNNIVNYGNIAINNGLKQGFEAAEKDPDIKSVNLFKSSSPRENVEIPRNDFHKFTNDLSSCDTIIRERIIETELKLRTANFDKGKWKAVYQSENISFVIEDQDFWDQVKNDLVSFHSTTSLNVRMKVIQKYDPILDEFITDKTQYTVLKVLGITNPNHSKKAVPTQKEEQMRISFEE